MEQEYTEPDYEDDNARVQFLKCNRSLSFWNVTEQSQPEICMRTDTLNSTKKNTKRENGRWIHNYIDYGETLSTIRESGMKRNWSMTGENAWEYLEDWEFEDGAEKWYGINTDRNRGRKDDKVWKKRVCAKLHRWKFGADMRSNLACFYELGTLGQSLILVRLPWVSHFFLPLCLSSRESLLNIHTTSGSLHNAPHRTIYSYPTTNPYPIIKMALASI